MADLNVRIILGCLHWGRSKSKNRHLVHFQEPLKNPTDVCCWPPSLAEVNRQTPRTQGLSLGQPFARWEQQRCRVTKAKASGGGSVPVASLSNNVGPSGLKNLCTFSPPGEEWTPIHCLILQWNRCWRKVEDYNMYNYSILQNRQFLEWKVRSRFLQTTFKAWQLTCLQTAQKKNRTHAGLTCTRSSLMLRCLAAEMQRDFKASVPSDAHLNPQKACTQLFFTLCKTCQQALTWKIPFKLETWDSLHWFLTHFSYLQRFHLQIPASIQKAASSLKVTSVCTHAAETQLRLGVPSSAVSY